MAPLYVPKVHHSLLKLPFITTRKYHFTPLPLITSSSPLFRSANLRSSSYSSHSAPFIDMNMNMNMNIPPSPAAAAATSLMMEFGGSDTTTATTDLTDGGDKYSKELEVAVKAVHMACFLCHKIQERLLSDGLPLDHHVHDTLADYWSVPATISWVLCEGLGLENVSILTEQDVEGLLMAAAAGSSNLVKNIAETVNKCLGNALSELGLIKSPDTPALDEKLVLAAINRYNTIGAQQNIGRFWVMDPAVNGISLALIDDGKPVVGVLGLCCQYRVINMSFVLYAASKGSGAWMAAYNSAGKQQMIKIKSSSIEDPELATICGTVQKPANSIPLSSMVKYAAIAEGDVEIFMKFGRGGNYKEKIWDHAAGVIISEEAGGVVTDAGGKPLDFSKGMYLEGIDRGIVACSGSVLHERILDAVDASWSSSCL